MTDFDVIVGFAVAEMAAVVDRLVTDLLAYRRDLGDGVQGEHGEDLLVT